MKTIKKKLHRYSSSGFSESCIELDKPISLKRDPNPGSSRVGLTRLFGVQIGIEMGLEFYE